MTTRYPQYQILIQQRLSPKRFKHSLNVMERAVYLSRIIGADPAKAELAGLLHDVEKNTDEKILLQNLQNSDILFSDADAVLPQLWHAPAGMLFVRDKLDIRDEDVLNAIRYHTTGRANMSPLEKTVYLADLTSADRDYPRRGVHPAAVGKRPGRGDPLLVTVHPGGDAPPGKGPASGFSGML